MSPSSILPGRAQPSEIYEYAITFHPRRPSSHLHSVGEKWILRHAQNGKRASGIAAPDQALHDVDAEGPLPGTALKDAVERERRVRTSNIPGAECGRLAASSFAYQSPQIISSLALDANRL